MKGAIEEFACFFYMTSGRMESTGAKGQQQLATKEAILKNCGNYIQRYISDDGSGECEAIAVFLYPALLNEIYKGEIPPFAAKPKSAKKPTKPIANVLIEQYMNNLAVYFESPDSFDEQLGVLKLKELVLILLKSEVYASVQEVLAEVVRPADVKFKQVIGNNLLNPLSLEELAFISGKSLSTFKRTFKKQFDEAPAKYIRQRRLEHAAQQLLCSEEAISAIAFDSGFQDVTTFSANFQSHFNCSPSAYRLNQNRK